MLEQLQIGGERGADQLERGEVLGGPVGAPERVPGRGQHAVLRPAGEPRHERVLRPEVVGGQAAARPRRLADPGEGGLLHAAFGDQRRGGVEQGLLGLLAPLGLGLRSRCWFIVGHSVETVPGLGLTCWVHSK